MTKNEWLIERARIISGKLTEGDLQRFYELFIKHCVAHFRTIDFATFGNTFKRWFGNPITIKNGIPVFTRQDTVINNMINYYDTIYHVVYLQDKTGKIIKVY